MQSFQSYDIFHEMDHDDDAWYSLMWPWPMAKVVLNFQIFFWTRSLYFPKYSDDKQIIFYNPYGVKVCKSAYLNTQK